MLCTMTSIHAIAERVVRPAGVVYPPLKDVRKSALRFTDIERVEFPRKQVVLKNYRNYQCEWPGVLSIELERALVLGDGTIVYGDQIIEETVSSAARRTGKDHGIVQVPGEGRWKVDDSSAIDGGTKPAFCATRYGIEYYGHWLVELLPRLKVARDTGLLVNANVLVPASYDGATGIWRTIRESSASIGVDEKSFVRIPPGGAWVRNLRFVSPLGRWGAMRPEVFSTFDEIRRSVVQTSEAARLYVTREDASSRRVLNDAAVRSVLAEYGFVVVRPSDLSFAEQVALFSLATVVCGPLGSGLANMVFAPEKAKIIALIPEKWDDLFFFDLACRRNQDWYEVRGEPSITAHKLYHRNDFTTDCDALRATIELALGSGSATKHAL